jgi:hypothetical protein
LVAAAKVLVTGMPGTGKSSALGVLAARGHRVVDTDEPGWPEYRPYPNPPDEVHRGEWFWVHARMWELLATPDDRALFVAGCVRNQSAFYERFDAVVLLTASAAVIVDRVATRTTNPYGKSDVERAMILDDLEHIEPLLRAGCTHELDAGRPLERVVADLESIALGVRQERAGDR